MLNMIWSASAAALAERIACRSEPRPSSAVVVTVNTASSTRCSSGSAAGEGRAAGADAVETDATWADVRRARRRKRTRVITPPAEKCLALRDRFEDGQDRTVREKKPGRATATVRDVHRYPFPPTRNPIPANRKVSPHRSRRRGGAGEFV